VLENDATAAAIGEHWLGASAEADHSILYYARNTAFGGGLILNVTLPRSGRNCR
jgi:predicted NBD/HSP70 family sugar kinase